MFRRSQMLMKEWIVRGFELSVCRDDCWIPKSVSTGNGVRSQPYCQLVIFEVFSLGMAQFAFSSKKKKRRHETLNRMF